VTKTAAAAGRGAKMSLEEAQLVLDVPPGSTWDTVLKVSRVRAR
jgi:hypothetical protein